MQTKELRKRLRTLAKTTIQRFPDVNYGGCCVFAAAVATELERLGVQHEVIALGPRDVDLNKVRPAENTMANWEWAGASFGHMGVRLKLDGVWHTYDAEAFLRGRKFKFGVRDNYYRESVGRWQAADGGLTAKEATELADSGNWNRMFYNRRNVQGVRKLVAQAFQ